MTQATKAPRLSQDALAHILDVTQKLALPYDLMHLLAEVVEAGESVLAADKASLWLYDAARDDLTMELPAFKPAPRLAAGQGLVGECLVTREIINVDNAYADPRFTQAVDKATGYKTQSVLNVPLLGWEKQPVGVLQLANKLTGTFDESDELLASTLAAQCAVAVQRMQLTEALCCLKNVWMKKSRWRGKSRCAHYLPRCRMLKGMIYTADSSRPVMPGVTCLTWWCWMENCLS